MKVDNQVKRIAEILWQFHNDRLKDPSIKEMKPYIDPLLQLIQEEKEKVVIHYKDLPITEEGLGE